MYIYTWPDTCVTNGTTVVNSVGTNSIEMSTPSTCTSSEAIRFIIVNDGVMYNQTITNSPSTYPNGTVFNWSFPNQFNDYGVYSYPNITYGIDGGYNVPQNLPPAFQVNDLTDLSVTYNISVNAGVDDYHCLIETWPTTVARPENPKTNNSMTDEIGFLCHTPARLRDYILSRSDHFNYSSDGFNAYIAVRSGTALTTSPPFAMIMPVTAPNGTTPLDMTSGTQTLHIKGVLDALVTHGVLPSNAYINGFQFGFEIGRGIGSATINNLTWNWNNGSAGSGGSSGPPAPTAFLTASPTFIPSGGSSKLTWNSSNATSCTSPDLTVGAVSGRCRR